MDTHSWIARLGAAGGVDQVITVVNEYIASRDPRELASLPEECGVRHMETGDEVAHCAYNLAAFHRHGEDARGIERIAAFFGRAAIRLAELSKGPPTFPERGPGHNSPQPEPPE